MNSTTHERWNGRLQRLHANPPNRPSKPPAPIDRTAHPEGAPPPVPLTVDPTDNTTPRVLAELDQALADLAEARRLAAGAVRRLHDSLPGHPTAPPTTVGRTIEVKLEDRKGILHWSCPLAGCARDPKARGTALNDIDAARAFHDHHADAHAADPSTQPERYAAVATDEAVRDLAEWNTLVRQQVRVARRLRDIGTKWGVTYIGAKVAEPTDTEWCTSCRRVNAFEPRRTEGGELCWWCDRTLRAINAVRAEHKMQPIDELPLGAAQKHARLAATSSRRVPITAGDIDTWAGIAGQARRTGRKTRSDR